MPGDEPKRKILTLDDLYHPDRKLDFEGKPDHEWIWIDSIRYARRPARKDVPDRTWWTASTASAEYAPLFDIGRMQEALGALSGVAAEDPAALRVLAVDKEGASLLVLAGDALCLHRPGDDSAIRVAEAIDAEAGAAFSPDDRWIAYVHQNNLHVADAVEGTTRWATRGGAPSVLTGRLDWVYQEELYGRGNFGAYWWSPDSTRIAFLELDVSAVSMHALPGCESDDPNRETFRYPRAGTANPTARLGVAGVDDGAVRWIEPLPEDPDDLLIVNVAWSGAGDALSFQVQDRQQTWLELRFADPVSGARRRVVRETSPAWVRTTGPPLWLEDGSFVWRSDRSGWSHLYRYRSDGAPAGAITSGDWDVRQVHGAAGNSIYFSGTERSSISLHSYRVSLDGDRIERLTRREGTHRPVFAPDMAHFIDACSDATGPARVGLYRSCGEEIRSLETPPTPAESGYELGATDYIQVKTRDEVPLEAMMIKPPDFDPNRKYPVLCHVYGGPMTPLVRNAWGGTTFLWHHMIASRGAIVWIVDPRTASGKGVRSAYPVYRRFGAGELLDLEDSIGWLRGQRYVDPERIGIWGWSFGGYLTAYAMTHSRMFRAGIAGAPVTDWKLYDTIYTERYMQTPDRNPEGYRTSSVLEAAAALHGKLLIVHGASDENVHLDHSMRLIRRLQRARKDFDVMVYPGAGHAIEDRDQLYDLRRRMTHFILENL